jgi:UDP-N-acetylmuramate dehydrogenase
MHIQHNYNLKQFNTFGIEVNAANFVTVTTQTDLLTLTQLPQWNLEKCILGGGSNIIYPKCRWTGYKKRNKLH